MSEETNNELDSAYSKIEWMVLHSQSMKKALDELGKGLTERIVNDGLLRDSKWYIPSCNSRVLYGKRNVIPEFVKLADLIDSIKDYYGYNFYFEVLGLKMSLRYDMRERDSPFWLYFDAGNNDDAVEPTKVVSALKTLGIKLDTRGLTAQVKQTEERLKRERAFRDAFKA